MGNEVYDVPRVVPLLDELGHGLALQQLGLRREPHEDQTGLGGLERLDPVEQDATDPRLQGLDPLAHRGGRDVEVAGRRLEGPEPHRDRQCAQGHRVQLSDVFHS